MHIGHILDEVYDRDVGWRPTSGAIKPVHVANGLARAVQGRYYDPRALHEFVVWWRSGKKPDDRRTFAALVEEADDGALRAFRGQRQQFDRARKYALGLLGGDGALFPSRDLSSFSLTSGRMATRDSNDRGLGELGAALLGAGSGALGDELSAALSDDAPRDPVTALVWPLLPEQGKEAKPKGRAAEALGRKHNRELIAAVDAATAALATHERAQGNRMRTLERAVQFVCVTTFSQAQALGAGGRLAARAPALLAMGPRGSEIARASERSVELIYASFERWLAERLALRIRRGEALVRDEEPLEVETLDGRSIRALLGKIGDASKTHGAPDPALLRSRMMHFTTARDTLGIDDPAAVVASTLVRAHCEEFKSGGPRRFLQGLECKVGLLYPHFQGRSRAKRLRPSTSVLDMLVRACVAADEGAVPIDDFFERLWTRFGILVGGRRGEAWDDAERLATAGVSIDGEALSENAGRFVDQLAAMGLARRYADDVAFVGVGHAE